MRKKYITALMIGLLLITLILSVFIPKISKDTFDLSQSSIRYLDQKTNELKSYSFSDSEVVKQLAEAFEGRVYYKQPFVPSWSREEVSYEMILLTQNKFSSKRYLILINENEQVGQRLAFLSRVNVESNSKISPFLNQKYSIDLSDQQIKMILKVLANNHLTELKVHQ